MHGHISCTADWQPFCNSLDDTKKAAVAEAEVFMIDGNEMDAAQQGCLIAKQHGTKVLYDCGGLYPGVERVLKLTDVMIPSEEFAMGHTGEGSAEAAARKLYEMYSPRVVVVTQGKRGGILFDGKNVTSYPIYPAEVVRYYYFRCPNNGTPVRLCLLM